LRKFRLPIDGFRGVSVMFLCLGALHGTREQPVRYRRCRPARNLKKVAQDSRSEPIDSLRLGLGFDGVAQQYCDSRAPAVHAPSFPMISRSSRGIASRRRSKCPTNQLKEASRYPAWDS
jgi:hypothetical protein